MTSTHVTRAHTRACPRAGSPEEGRPDEGLPTLTPVPFRFTQCSPPGLRARSGLRRLALAVSLTTGECGHVFDFRVRPSSSGHLAAATLWLW